MHEGGRFMVTRIGTIQCKLLLAVLILLAVGCDLHYDPSDYDSGISDTKYFTALHNRQFRNMKHPATDSCDNCHVDGSAKMARKFKKPMSEL